MKTLTKLVTVKVSSGLRKFIKYSPAYQMTTVKRWVLMFWSVDLNGR